MINRFLASLVIPFVIAASPIAGNAQTEPVSPAPAPQQAEPQEPFVADGTPGEFGYEFAALLYGKSLDSGRAFAEARLVTAPEDQTARMALGVTQFAEAVQGLARDLHRHGLHSPKLGLLPFFRLPVEPNAEPEPLDYEGARQILIGFVERLAVAEATLAGVDDPAVELRLRPALVRFDTNNDGIWSDEERFSRIYGQYTARRSDPAGLVDFDGSDAPWFRGYCHLLSAMAEAWLAHDWHEGFEASFHSLFPDSGLPNAALNDLPRARSQQAEVPPGHDPDSFSGNMMEDAYIADALAYFHLIHWPVAEPARLASAREHLKAMIAMSRESWRRIRSETDDAQEWIPGPDQALAQGDNRPAAVTEEAVAGWLQFLDTFEMVLDGTLLLPHWRLEGGINLKRVFLEPRTFDVVLWFQGSAALPYIEDGPVADSATWEPIGQLMGGNFMTYFVWFN